MPQKLTKQAEDRILKALTEIAELTNNNVSPNEAIVKVATDMRIPHGHIQLIVNAYNTGRTTVQRKSSDNVWEKAADFELADTSKILDRMYPDAFKKQADVHRENVVSYEYDLSPHWVAKRESLEKQARKFDWKMVDKPVEYPVDPTVDYRKAKVAAHKLDLEVDEARRRASVAWTYAVDATQDLANYFKHAGHRPYCEVKDNAVAMWGEPAEALFRQIDEKFPQYKKQSAAAIPAPARGTAYELVQRCMEANEAFQALRQAHTEKQASAERQKEELMRPFVPGPKLDPVLGLPVSGSVVTATSEKQAGGFMGDLVKHYVMRKVVEPYSIDNILKDPVMYPSKDSGLPPKTTIPEGAGATGVRAMPSVLTYGLGKPQAYYDAAKERLHGNKSDYDPDKLKQESILGEDHQQDLDELDHQSMLTDILSNDEVLSHRDPHKVLQAYGDVRNTFPRVAANPDMLRAVLRDKLEKGHHALFELETMSKLEKNLKEINKPNGKPGGEE